VAVFVLLEQHNQDGTNNGFRVLVCTIKTLVYILLPNKDCVDYHKHTKHEDSVQFRLTHFDFHMLRLTNTDLSVTMLR
jgi:hypothetical protein